MKYHVLDTGHIEVVGVLGGDTTVVNAARVSFGKEVEHLSGEDIRLISYLAKNKHDSPFRHIMFQLRIKAPEFVMRQWYKHVVGIETTSTYPTKDHAWNEISQRYVKEKEFYVPETWRKQSEDNKQGSEGTVDNRLVPIAYDNAIEAAMNRYEHLVELGVAKEMARMLLPLSVYTEVFWTASFQAVMNFISLRDHDHAQVEIREYAVVLRQIAEHYAPESTKAWDKHRLS